VYLLFYYYLSLSFLLYSICSYEEFSLHRRRKEEPEPEVDPERDQRTVFAFQVAFLNKSFTMLLF
jgi:hypothetical protein